MLKAPHPELDDLLEMIAQTGYRMAEVGTNEGAASNSSVCLRWPVDIRTHFPVVDEIQCCLEIRIPQPLRFFGKLRGRYPDLGV